MKTLKISVIVVVKDMAKDLRRCLASLKNQDYYELIVVDGYSSDNSVKIAKKFTSKVFSFNGSIGDSRNYGIKKSKGNVIAFIDADCVASPNWIKYIKDNISNSQPVVGGKVLLKNHKNNNLLHLGAHLFWFSPFMTKKEKNVRTIPTCNIAYLKKLFNNRGFKNLSTAEDVEFNYYLYKRGVIIKYIPDMIVYHKPIKSFYDFLKKVKKRGKGFLVSRRRYDLPHKFPKNKLLFYVYLPLFFILSSFKSILDSFRINFLKTFALIPFFLITRFYFTLGVLSDSSNN